MPAPTTASLTGLVSDLQRVFSTRLLSVVAYGRPHTSGGLQPSLALVTSLSIDDLDRCAGNVSQWHEAGAATPLVLPREEFAQSLDSFPIEFGEIIAEHAVVLGNDPFDGLAVAAADLRRAAEVHARSLLLHVRENYIETGGRPADVAELVTSAAPGLAVLLRLLARLEMAQVTTLAELDAFAASRFELDARIVGDLLHLAEDSGSGVEAARLFPGLLGVLDVLVHHVDRWSAAS